jgi:WD40 repeat protein
MRRLLLLWLCGCSSPSSWADLDGRVVIDGADDNSGVTVRAVGPVTAAAVTDADGHYRLPALKAGEYALAFEAADTLEDEEVVHLSVSPAPQAAPDVRFTAVGALEGTVTLDGRPGGGVVMFVDGAGNIATSDGDGHYRLDRVPAGTRTLQAVLAGYRGSEFPGIRVSRGQTTEAPPLDLAVDGDPPYPVAALAGTALRIDRDDHSGTTVTATRGSTTLTTTTAKDGSYHFDGLPTGLYQLDFAYDGHTENIPQVLALAGSTGQVVDDALYPLEANPIHLPQARRLAHDRSLLKVLDGDRALVWSAGGVDRNDQTVEVLSLADGTLTKVVDDANRTNAVVVSDSLKKLLYIAGVNSFGGVLRLAPLDGSPPSTLADFSDGYNYVFSKDESRVIFTSQGSLYTVPVGGGTPVLISGGVNGPVVAHPDGQRLVFLTCTAAWTDCQVRVDNLDGTAPLKLLDGNSSFFVAPDGAHVINVANYDSNQGTGQLWLAAIDGTGVRKLFDGLTPGWVSWSPDGRYAAFTTDKTDLRLVDVTGSADPAVVAHDAQSPTFSGDGTRLLYQHDYQTYSNTSDLMQQPAGGGSELQLGSRVDSFLFSGDGTRVLFLADVDAGSRLGTLKVEDSAGNVVVLGTNVFPGSLFAGDRVLYRGPDPTRLDLSLLWSVATSGGSAVSLGETIGSTWVSPGGQRVVWSTDEKVLMAPTAGGAPQVVGVGYPAWASDTRLLLSVGVMPPYRHQSGLYAFEVTP